MSTPDETQFTCPHCERRIFNRRLAKCEFCDGELPSSVLLSAEEQVAIDAEALQRAEKRRERDELRELARKGERRRGGTLPPWGTLPR